MSKKILIISHNVLGKETNMGKTLESQFKSLKSGEIAQLYFSAEKPDSSFCNDFFSIPDYNVLKSIINRKPTGRVVTIHTFNDNKRDKDFNLKDKVRKKGNRRPLMYLVRNTIWNLGIWESKELYEWIDRFSPDLIYFASGDYSFSYKITLKIAKRYHIPLIIGCYDDFYLNKMNKGILINYIHKNFMKHVYKLFEYATCFTAVSDMMREDYSNLFKANGYTLYTPSLINTSLCTFKENRIIYAGNLGQGRAEQLIKMGKVLKEVNNKDFYVIDVYSGEVREEIIHKLSTASGIKYHGKISPDKVNELIIKSKFLIHVESFDTLFKNRVKYSLSTKIADYLASGSCVISFGPSQVASINYLMNNNASYIIDNEGYLKQNLKKIIDTNELRYEICQNALKLAKTNHNQNTVNNILNQIIGDIFDEVEEETR